MNTYKRVFDVEKDKLEQTFFVLREGDEVSENEIQPELLKILYEVDPALDSITGKLCLGKRKEEISCWIHLSNPDTDGISHVAGLGCKNMMTAAVSSYLEDKGYEVK